MGARFFAGVTAVAAATFSAFPTLANEVGTLICVTSGGPAAHENAQDVTCHFTSNHRDEVYSGKIKTSGLFYAEIVSDTEEVWTVEATTPSVPQGALAGTYKGGIGRITFGAFGLGGFRVSGGYGGSYVLQHGPFDVRVGMGFKFGEIRLELQSAEPKPEPAVNLVAVGATSTLDPQSCSGCAR
jgi:hypothetical protein